MYCGAAKMISLRPNCSVKVLNKKNVEKQLSYSSIYQYCSYNYEEQSTNNLSLNATPVCGSVILSMN